MLRHRADQAKKLGYGAFHPLGVIEQKLPKLWLGRDHVEHVAAAIRGGVQAAQDQQQDQAAPLGFCDRLALHLEA